MARKDIIGFQLAGFANVAANNAEVVQIAGFSNTAKDTLTGFQLSGFINTAKHVKGSQLGFINVCDTIEKGIPIGFISIVRKGYHTFEIGTEYLHQLGPSDNMYYNYYATQVLRHYGGSHWEEWNNKLRDSLVKSQDTKCTRPGAGIFLVIRTRTTGAGCIARRWRP